MRELRIEHLIIIRFVPEKEVMKVGWQKTHSKELYGVSAIMSEH